MTNADQSTGPLDLDAIRERAAKASEGPWRRKHAKGWMVDREDGGSTFIGIGDDRGDEIFALAVAAYPGDDGLSDNADFIAHARQDIPALLAELDRVIEGQDILSREIIELRNELDRRAAGDAEKAGLMGDLLPVLEEYAVCYQTRATKPAEHACRFCLASTVAYGHTGDDILHTPSCLITRLREAGR